MPGLGESSDVLLPWAIWWRSSTVCLHLAPSAVRARGSGVSGGTRLQRALYGTARCLAASAACAGCRGAAGRSVFSALAPGVEIPPLCVPDRRRLQLDDG